MSADLSIHVLGEVPESMLARFNSNVMGSKWFNPRPGMDDEAFEKIGDTPSVWIGEVSWLKAALFEDGDKFIPGPVEEISALIGEELPVLTEELRDKILAALSEGNATSYSVAKPDKVRPFLDAHMGARLFTVSW